MITLNRSWIYPKGIAGELWSAVQGTWSTEALKCIPECSAAELAFSFMERYKNNIGYNMSNGSDCVLLCYLSDRKW